MLKTITHMMSNDKKIALYVILAASFLSGVFLLGYLASRQINIIANAPIMAPELVEAANVDNINSINSPFNLPANFSMTVFAKNLPNARVIIFDSAGRLIVSLKDSGRIVVLNDTNMDGKADESRVLLEKLRHPHGLAIKCNSDGKGCLLFVAEEKQVSVYGYDVDRVRVANKKKLADLPAGGRHTTRSLQLAVIDGKEKLLVSIGSSCNVCHEKDSRRASIVSMNLDGSEQKKFAKGLRNTVFMTENPKNGEIWGTDMGRDFLGDKLPPDEINLLAQGKDYGWPTCYGRNIHDGKFDKNVYIRNPCSEPFTQPSRIDLPAHTAPLGLAFFPAKGWPAEFQNNLLVALHGSWNSKKPVGYKIVRLKLNARNELVQAEDFMTGFLTKKLQVIGRPVAIAIRPDGAIYVSDDSAGAIYRLKYQAPAIKCQKSGCSGQICADRDVTTTCEYRPEYDCYKAAICESQASGQCGFRRTSELEQCLSRLRGVN